MKKVFLSILICFTIFCCSGCVKYSYDIEINNKDEIAWSQIQAFNINVFKSLDSNFESKWDQMYNEISTEYKNEGFNVEQYQDETFAGFKIAKNNIKLGNFKDNLPAGFQSKQAERVIVEKGFVKTTYKLDLIYNADEAMNKAPGGTFSTESGGEKTETYASNNNEPDIISKETITDPATGDVIEKTVYSNGSTSTSRYNPKALSAFSNSIESAVNSMPGMQPVMDLTIKIPVKASKTNAAKIINDKEYQWSLVSEEPVEIVLEYSRYDFSSVGIIASFAAVLALIAFWVKKSKEDVFI